MKIKNKGVTYYELLIVIAIMSLMVAFATISIGTVHRNNVYRAADNIESSVKAARNNALSKGNKYGYVNFYYKDKKLFVNFGDLVTSYDSSKQDWRQISYSIDGVKITYSDGSSFHNCYNGDLFNLSFKQSTGECFGLMLPYEASTIYPGDVIIEVKNGKNTAKVNVGQFGKIEVK